MKKVCTKCSVKKLIKEFTKDIARKDGRCPWCKKCKNEKGKIYKIVNKKMIAKKKRNKRIETQEVLNQYERDYYYANKEKRLEQAKESRLRRIGKIKKTKHIYYLANRKEHAKRSKKYHQGLASYETFVDELGIAETVTEASNGDMLVPCTYCGKLYTPTNGAVLNRLAALAGRQRGEVRLYCSEACKQACPSYGQISKWKTQKSVTSREVSAYFRQAVLKRDGWTCQRCGAGIEDELHVHHIEGVVQNPILSNDLENGITLCKGCHKKVHKQAGCTYYELRCFDERKAA